MTPPAAAASSVQRGAKLAPPRSRPRRVSGPTRPASRTRPQAKPASTQDGLVVGLIEAVETLSSHRLLDRLIRGRVWIVLLAFALIGIVTLQLGLLKLNSGIGRAIERSAKLQTENASLSIENSELASGDRVESQAEGLGMKLVSIDGLHFLSSHARSDVAHAASVLRQPLQPSSETSTEASQEETTATAGTSETASEHESSGAETPAETPAETSTESTTSTPSETSSPSSSESQAPSTIGSGETAAAGPGGGTASPAG
jgi:cell division protein FtsL